jgi:hypothetical protein
MLFNSFLSTIIVYALGFVFIVFLAYIFFYVFKKKKSRFLENSKVFDRVLFQIRVPKTTGRREEEIHDSREQAVIFTGVFEQLLSAMSSIYEEKFAKKMYGQEYFSLELAIIDGQITFYMSAPGDLANLLEKQIHSAYPSSSVEKIKFYNPFRAGQHVAIGELALTQSFIYPIKTYPKLESDSLQHISGALSRINESSTGLFQILIRPVNNSWRSLCEDKIKQISENPNFRAENTNIAKGVKDFAKDIGKAAAGKDISQQSTGPKPLSAIDEIKIESLKGKASKIGFETKIRLLTASSSQEEADHFLNQLFSSYAQFHNPEGNGFKLKKPDNRAKFLTDLIFRRFGPDKIHHILNVEELASIYHLPAMTTETPNINWLAAKDAPPPANLPQTGTLLGQSLFRGQQKLIYIQDEDRRRHLYAIGKTGTGKTTLFVNMILSDIRAGKGVCYIDPHGDAVEEIIAKIPANRANDVVLFDPGDILRPMGLNLLEYTDVTQRDFLVQEAIQIFYKLFDPNQMGVIGPQWEHWMRNACLTIMAQPWGGTLIDIPKLFIDKEFLQKCLENVKDQPVKDFWKKQMEQTAEFHKSEMLNYFTSKFGRFVSNSLMKNVIGQSASAFNFRQMMDEGKILLINLSKGKIGEINSNLLGMICVAKLQSSAMSRAATPEEQRKDFYLYVDEFQNFATENFSQILSEARKYHLNLNITNQYIAQLEEKIRDSVFGNVGTLISFRIGAQDAEYMEKEFIPTFNSEDLINVDKYHAYIKLLINGVTSPAFGMMTVKNDIAANPQMTNYIRNYSRIHYGKDANLIAENIDNRFISDKKPEDPTENEAANSSNTAGMPAE